MEKEDPSTVSMHFHEEKVTIGKPDPAIVALLADKGNETNASIAEEEKSV